MACKNCEDFDPKDPENSFASCGFCGRDLSEEIDERWWKKK